MPDTNTSATSPDAPLDAALAALAGLALSRLERAGDTLWIQLGALRPVEGDAGSREVGAWALHVSCPWRWYAGDRVLVGSGDLLTPADADVELEDYDWDEPGASWLDVRLGELGAHLAESPASVFRATRDRWLGLRLELDDDTVLELFPNSTPTGHVSTEFWRLFRPGAGEAHLVTGTFGIDREA
jgi:hypothetical protein